MKRPEVAPLLDAAQAALGALAQLGLQAAIVGGFAVAVRGRPRLTKDVDLVVLADLDRLDEALAALKAAGLEPRQSDALAFARATRVLLLRHVESAIEVDLSFGALPFERELVENATVTRLGGRELPIARAEDLLIMKSLALRPRDVADIEGLLELNDDLDLERVRRTVAEFTVALEDADFIGELEQILRRVRKPRR